MRALATIVMLAAAAPAAAQNLRAFELGREAQAAAEAQAARTRDIQLTNELSVLQARMQSEQAIANLQAARAAPLAPTVPFNPHARPPVLNASQMASIPDAALADSNARVRAAADNRR